MQELDFVSLGINSMYFDVLSNASVANAPGMKSQAGYMIFTANKVPNAKIMPHKSSWSHRITCFVMSPNGQALIRVVDVGMIMADVLKEKSNHNI